jgi:hypothetical protein
MAWNITILRTIPFSGSSSLDWAVRRTVDFIFCGTVIVRHSVITGGGDMRNQSAVEYLTNSSVWAVSVGDTVGFKELSR